MYMFLWKKHKTTKDESLIITGQEQGKAQFGTFISESVGLTVVKINLTKKSFSYYNPLFNSLNRFSIKTTRQSITIHRQLRH